jgi:hypothetical protein
MPDFDFAGLRTAVEDAAERAPFDQLVERAAVRRRRRRIGTGLGLLVLVILAAATAAGTAGLRSDRLPATPPTPPPAEESPPSGTQLLLDAKFGPRHAYALIGACAVPDRVATCRYVLLQSADAGRTWQRRRSQPLAPPAGNAGFSAELLLAGPDRGLAILDPGHDRVYQPTDRVDTYSQRQIRSAPPVEAIPPAAAVRTSHCEGNRDCWQAVVALDPTTGIAAPLRHQPPLGVPASSATFDDRGGLWVAGASAGGTGPPRTAYSADRGQSWRPLPVPRGPRGVLGARVYPLPSGRGAYLIGARYDRPDVKNDFAELWRIGDPAAPGAEWSRITPASRPASAMTAVGLAEGSLLFTEETGGLWRVSPTGETHLVEADVSGTPLRPHAAYRGPGSLIYALDQPDGPALSVLVSDDDGRTWRRSILPGS